MVDAGRRLAIVFVVSIVLMTLVPSVVGSDRPVSQAIVSVDVADAAPAAIITSEAMNESKHILRTAYERPVTQAEVAYRLESMMKSEGADGDLAFATLVMSGSELSSPHGNPYDDSSHVIDPETDPVVMIDMGCKYNGHCADVTRTFFFENATQEMFDAYDAVQIAHEAVLAAIGPGVEISTLDAILEVYLANYTDIPGVSLLTYWGHGVGEFVHEHPILYNTPEELMVDDVLAIEPGIYFNDAGWAVRIEDTVRVTETGVEILSQVPRDLEDVMILRNQPYVDTDITVTGYAYGSEATIDVSVSDTASRSINGIDWFDGYSWHPMDHLTGSHYNFSYDVNYTYSGRLECMARVQLANDTYYFRRVVWSSVIGTGITIYDPALQFNDELVPPGASFLLVYDESGADLMRIRFRVMTGGWDQILIEDSLSRPVHDYRLVSDSYLWSPWVTGDSLRVHVVATEPEFLGGFDTFSFSIDRIEFFFADSLTTTTTTTTTSTTTSTTETTSTSTTSTTTGNPTTTSGPPSGGYPSELTLVWFGGAACLVVVLVVLWKRRV
jgi:methionine aminopeptidase